jgi:glycosyltransferase involved in cell wall biosynthesis
MRKHPLVSIIIPTYNRPEFVIKAVESALNQTYQHIEVIVVDDASEMNIQEVLPSDQRIRYFKNIENRGGGFSRNVGLDNARGEFVNFLDDDDELYPDKIEKQVSCFLNAQDPNLGMVTCHTSDERSGKPRIFYNRVRGDIHQQLLARYAVYGTETMLFRRNALKNIGGFDGNLVANQEYDLMIRFSEHYSVDFVDDVLCRKKRSYNQISRDLGKKIKGARQLFQKHKSRFKREGLGFYLKVLAKHYGLMTRFYAGAIFGENVYRLLLMEGQTSKRGNSAADRS